MHDIDRTLAELDEADAYEGDFGEIIDELNDAAGETDSESPFSEQEETDLAAELLTISSEEELDHFLGGLMKRAWRGARRLGSAALQAARPLGGMLRNIAKQHLPSLGRVAGMAFGPLGGTIGGALGKAIGNALESELDEAEDRELEMARRFVRVAGSAARGAVGGSQYGLEPSNAARRALLRAARRHLPGMAGGGAIESSSPHGARSGRWIRRGRKIILLGV
jgi:hypothetical protein